MDPTDWTERQRTRQRRRARIVQAVKTILPVVALGLIGLIFVMGREQGDIGDLFSAEELARLGTGLRLDNPRLAGIADGELPYELTAAAAMPDGPMAQVIELEAPEGEVRAPDRTYAASAARGVLDRRENRLTLEGGVSASTSDGWKARAPGAVIDLEGQTATGTGRLVANGPNGALEAGGFSVESGGDTGAPVLHFKNGVRVLFTPPEKE